MKKGLKVFWMRILVSLIFTLIVSSEKTIAAVTSQQILSDTTWSGTVNVSSEVLIADGVTLTVLPGTHVVFTGYYPVKVQGRLLAVGTSIDSIRFYPASNETGWEGIVFDGTSSSNDSSKFCYAVFSYGKANSNSCHDGYGGAIYLLNFGKLLVSNCNFHHNQADYSGGAIYCNAGAPVIQNSRFAYNNGTGNAGAIQMSHCDPVVTNNLFIYNTAGTNGGAINFNVVNIHLTNCTFFGNYAGYAGGALYLDYYSSFIATNCIFYEDVCTWGAEVAISNNAFTSDFYYCDVKGGLAGIGGLGGPAHVDHYENCFDEDPVFTGSGNHPFSIQAASPCVNAGKPDMTGLEVLAEDLAGNQRIRHLCYDRIDIGAYEYQEISVITFEGNVAADTYWCADTVRITGNVTVNNGVTLTIGKGVLVYFTDIFSMTVNGCILAESESAYPIVFKSQNLWPGWTGIIFADVSATNDTSRFTNCRFENGNAPWRGSGYHGGAFYISNYSKIRFSGCRFQNNWASSEGGALFINSANLNFTHCIFNNNEAVSGGAITAHNSTINISGSQFSSNIASQGDCYYASASLGGAIYLNTCTSSITNCNISNNNTSCRGGGIYATSVTMTLTGDTISNNTAGDCTNYGGGGGLACYSSTIQATGNIFSHNSSSWGGGLFLNGVGGNISNNIITGNSGHVSGCGSSEGGGIVFGSNSNPTFTNNMVTYNSAAYCAGIDLSYSSPEIINNLISNNSAGTAGGGIAFNNSSSLLLNNTVCNNTGVNFAGGLYFKFNSSPVIRNNILYGNRAYHYGGNQVYMYDHTSNPDFYYCDIESGRSGFGGFNSNYDGDYENNIDQDPAFYNSGDHPYQLQPGSPCLNTGDPSTGTGTAGTLDLAGNPRIQNGRIEMGSYEMLAGEDVLAGSAIHFLEDNDSIVLEGESRFNFSNAFTVECWLKIDPMSNGYHTIIQKGTGWELRMSYDDEITIIEFGINGNSIFGYYETTGPELLHKWNHIAGVFNLTPGNEYVTIYVNGIQGSMDIAEALVHNSQPVTVGSGILGQMDELRIWSTARSDNEVRQDMHLTVNPDQSGLVAYFQFNHYVGNKVVDYAGGNNGTLCNMSVPACFIASTAPASGGESNLQIITGTGPVNFTGTGLTMNVSSPSSQDTIVVSRLDAQPNIDPPDANKVYDRFWIIETYGDPVASADLTFAVPQTLSGEDQIHLDYNRLYSRESNSDSNWTFIMDASEVDVTGNTVTFNDMQEFSQFCIPHKLIPEASAGYALSFDGDSAYVSIDTLYHTCPGAVTAEAWFYLSELPLSGQYLIYHGDNGEFGLMISATQSLFHVKLSNNTWYNVLGPAPEINTWQHICGVWENNGVLKLYLNGEVCNTVTIPALPLIDAGIHYPPSIGAYSRISGFFNGTLDEVRVWSTSRSTQQIRENMHLTLNGDENGLIGYWQFNEGSGWYTEDFGGNHDGALRNMTAQSWITSSVPAGGGTSNTRIIASHGINNFTGTGIKMFVRQKTGTDTVVVSRINSLPNILPPADTNYSSQYWVVNVFGQGTLNADMEFTIAEDLKDIDKLYPENIGLLRRASRSESIWLFESRAISAESEDNTILFSDIDDFGQFAVAKGLRPDIVLDPDSIVFGRTPSTIGISDSVMVYNQGTDTLFVSGISHVNNQFILAETQFYILPGENRYLTVTYHPDSEGNAYDTLHLSSNDPDDPLLKVYLRGEGFIIDTWPGKALSFSGYANYIRVPDNNTLDLTTNYTIEAWINPQGFSSLAGIVSKYQFTGSNGYYVRLTGASPYSGLCFDGMNTAQGVLTQNIWYHIAAVNNNGTRTLYVNGVSISLSGTAEQISSNGDPLCIGVDYFENGRFFQGKIDEVRIWNIARSEQEIRENMHLTLKGNETGLVSYWQLNHGSGATAVDKIHGNNGAMYNFGEEDWINSTIPAGGGTSCTHQVNSTGPVDFQGTGVTMDFTLKTGEDQFVVTRIDTNANINPDGQNRPFDKQYWVVRQYGSGTFSTGITFTVAEDITTWDEIDQKSALLFRRTGNADIAWTFADSSTALSALNNSATFNGLTGFSQFMIAARLQPDSVPGTALSFNGSNQYISFAPLYSSPPAALTVEAWVYPEDVIEQSYIIYHGDNGEFGLWISQNLTGFQVKLADNSWHDILVSNLHPDKWNHVCAVWEQVGTLKVYQDGNLLDSIAIPSNPLFDPGDGYLPSLCARNRGSYYLKGKLDEVRIWNKALNINEIRNHVYAVLDGREEGLIAYWQFNEGSGSHAADGVEGHNGTLMNMSVTNWVESTVPVPFQTINNGNWSDQDIWNIGQGVPQYTWSRVRISNSVMLDQDKSVKSLKIDDGKSLVIPNPGIMTVTGEE